MNNRKVFRIIAGLLLVALAAGGIMSIRNTTLLPDLDVQNVQAAPLTQTTTGTTVYLPMAINRFPVQTTFGIEMSRITDNGGLTDVEDAETTWVRRNGVHWADLEPVEGQINWDAPEIKSLDQELASASQAGFDTILVIFKTPPWAQMNDGYYDGYYCGPMRPDKIDAFADFVSQIVERYSKPPYNVQYWQLWNEQEALPEDVGMDSPYGCWGNSSDPYNGGGYYADMLEKVYPRIKQVDPSAQVVMGGLLLACKPELHDICPSKSLTFLEGVLRHDGANDGGNYFDYLAFHAYDHYAGVLGQYGNSSWTTSWDTNGPVLEAKTDFLKNILAAYGYSDKPILNTEGGLLCGASGLEDYCVAEDFQLTKAYYVMQYYGAGIAEGLKANIWYSVYGWRGSGLLDKDTHEPLPAYYAYKVAREKLADAQFVRRITEYPNVLGFEFYRNSKRIWMVWSQDGMPHVIDLPKTPKAVWDPFGNQDLSVTTPSLTVTIQPVYVDLP